MTSERRDGDDELVDAELVDDEFDEFDDDDGEDADDEDGGPLAQLGGMGDLLSGLGGGGMPDLGSMMQGLAAVQDVQQAEFEGSAGGGLVRIRANGRMEVQGVRIERGALGDPGEEPDLEMLADLVHAALSDLSARIAAAQQEAMGPLGGLLGM